MRLISHLLSLLGLGKADNTRSEPQDASGQHKETQAPDVPQQAPAQENPEQNEKNAPPVASVQRENTEKQDAKKDAPDAPPESGEKSEALRRFEAMTMQEQRRFMIERLLEHFIPRTAALPETGLFQPISLCIRYPGTKNLAFLKVEMDSLDRTHSRRLIAFCLREGTDMAVNHYLEKGTTDDLVAWLKREETIADLRDSFDQLSDSVDDKW